MTSTDTTAAASTAAAPAQRSRAARRRWWRRSLLKRSTIWVHRWSALVLGLALLVITTTGAVLVYEPQLEHLAHHSAYAASGGDRTLDLPAALERARAGTPGFHPDSSYRVGNTIVTEQYDPERKVTIDAVTGRLMGDYDPRAGAVGWTVGLFDNVHECFFSCEGEPLYASWLGHTTPIPFLKTYSWAGLALGALAILLLFLSVSGIWLWWPGLKRWVVGVRVRWRKGRYARDYDLHQVAGMVAVPLLLVWAYSGMVFEFPWVTKAYYQVIPGEASATPEFASVKSSAPDLAPAEAVASAKRLLGTSRDAVSLDVPGKDATATYTVWFHGGRADPYQYVDYTGDLGVGVDRHTGRAQVTYGADGRRLLSALQEDWNFPLHTGSAVNVWWRTIWFGLGMVPLLLAVTGVSTWLYKRKVRKRRRAARSGAGPREGTTPVPV